jgi:DNA-binding transcriptional LysR family regulator
MRTKTRTSSACFASQSGTQRDPLKFIRNGLAIGMLPRSLVETTSDIAFVPIRDHEPQFQTAIATPANRRLSAATRATLDTIKRHTAA